MSPNVRVPVIDADSAPFWEAVAAHQLTAQKCAGCSRFIFYPRAVCPYCHSDKLAWEPLSGTGTVYSVTVSRRAPSPEFADLVPYVVALIDLDEGCRMMSNIIGYDAALARCGSRVAVQFQTVADGQVLPVFALTDLQEH